MMLAFLLMSGRLTPLNTVYNAKKAKTCEAHG